MLTFLHASRFPRFILSSRAARCHVPSQKKKKKAVWLCETTTSSHPSSIGGGNWCSTMIAPCSQTAFFFFWGEGIGWGKRACDSRWLCYINSKLTRLKSKCTRPFFPAPPPKEKKVVWLRETTLGLGNIEFVTCDYCMSYLLQYCMQKLKHSHIV